MEDYNKMKPITQIIKRNKKKFEEIGNNQANNNRHTKIKKLEKKKENSKPSQTSKEQEIILKIQEDKRKNNNTNIKKTEEQEDIEMIDETNTSSKTNKDLLKQNKTKSSSTPTPPPTLISLPTQSPQEIRIHFDQFIKSTEQRLPYFLIDSSYDNQQNNLANSIPQGYIMIHRYEKSGNLKSFMETYAKQEFSFLRQLIDNDHEHKSRLDEKNPNCRYSDIITYRDNKVLLNSSLKYINASWIHIPLPNYFISTQGPLPHTIEDFWTMIDQNGVSLIVMLCNLKEKNVDKCADYWNNVNNLSYLEIKLLSEKEEHKGIIIRNISLKNKLMNKENIVTQIHLTYWEDHAALEPSYFTKIIHVIKYIDNIKNINFNPCVVHCSAGVGRTGTFIGLYNLYHELMQQIMDTKTEKITFCIMNLVRKIKEMRMYSIENVNQYLLLYDFADYILSNYNIKKYYI